VNPAHFHLDHGLLCAHAMSRLGVGILLLLASACHPTGLGSVHALEVSPASLSLSSDPGSQATATFTLHNAGQGAELVKLSVGTPFSVAPSTLTLEAGADATLTVTFAPPASGRFLQTLSATSVDASATVALTGDTPCVSPDACHRSSRDPSTGNCVEAPLADGTACSNACLQNATCMAGQCVGAPTNCDDGNACTLDLCNADQGCLHVDATPSCPSDPCHTATCDPSTGCGLAPVDDGTLCGNGECAVQACIGGQCVARASPDGVPCGQASACQPAGVCHSGACARPPPMPLVPSWSYGLDAGERLWGPLMVDSAGQLHWLECLDNGLCDHVSFTPAGVQRFRTTLLGIRDVTAKTLITADDLLVIGIGPSLLVVRASDGGFVWTHDFTNDFQGTTPDCGGQKAGIYPSISSLADDGHGGLFVQLQSQSCSGAWNGDWTVKLDAQSGATQWQQPYLGVWLTCQGSYGNGRIVSDESGNAYVFDGFNGGDCSNRVTGVPSRIAAYDGAGTSLWSEPWGFVDWPTSIFGGVLGQESGQALSTADGGLLRTVPRAPGAFGVDAVSSTQGTYIIEGTITGPGVTLRHLDAQGTLQWSQWLDGGNYGIGDPLLTARDTLVLPMASDFGTPSVSSALIEVGPDGGISRCPLPAAEDGDYYQSVLLTGGWWISVRWNPWFRVDGYPVQHLEPATQGWVCPAGNPAHGGRPL
jgi:hypothetical protein